MLEYMINLNLRNLLKCIKENQFDANGKLISTTVFIKENLIKSQASGNLDFKESNTNYVQGEIKGVYETYVEILAKNHCSKDIIYTIFYSKILYIGSVVIEKINLDKCLKLNQCLKLGCNVSKMELEEINNCINMGVLINEAIQKNHDTNKKMQFVFKGILSNIHEISSVKVINTILFIENYYAISLSVVDGFALLPTCSQPNNKEDK